MREADYMQRLGLAVPDSAQAVLMQQEKFTRYFDQLTHALQVGWCMLVGGLCWLGHWLAHIY